MGIRPTFGRRQLNRYLRNGVETELHRRVLRNLNALGMQCVTLVRSLDTYKDRTSNLRNSIGYLIQKDGVVIDTFFQAVGGGTLGKDTGETYAKDVGKNYPNGYALIVVAGMEYAGYVEDVHNLPVLQPAKDFAEAKAPEIIERIKNLQIG